MPLIIRVSIDTKCVCVLGGGVCVLGGGVCVYLKNGYNDIDVCCLPLLS